MKILNLNDSHISGTNSINRLGNMYSDFMLKLDETIELSKKCDLVIHSGDVFHTAEVANNIVDDMVDKIEAAKIPWYILPGNHDMTGAHWNTSSGTSLAHIFRRSKLIQRLTELEDGDIYIKGFEYYHGIENDFKSKGITTDSQKKFKIAVTHAFISPKPFRPDVLHVEIKDIKSNFDYVLCSHFHHDTGATKHEGTVYTNCGAWGRRTITEVSHKPQVTILNVAGKKIAHEFVELQSAKPGNTIFDLAKKEDLAASNEDLETFISSLRDFKQQDLDLRGIVEFIGAEQKVDRVIIDLILKKLGEVNV